MLLTCAEEISTPETVLDETPVHTGGVVGSSNPDPEGDLLADKLRALLLSDPSWASKSSALAGLTAALQGQGSGLASSEPEDTAPIPHSLNLDQVDVSLQAAQPLEETSPNPQPISAPASAPHDAKPALPTISSIVREPRVLLVEDNKINLRLLQTFGIRRIIFLPSAVAASKQPCGVNIFSSVSNSLILFLMYFTATRSTSDGSEGSTLRL